MNLGSNNNIIIQKADKGNSVVIIDRNSYVNKMENLLSDTTKFVKIEFNPKHKVNKEIRHLLDMEENIKSCLDNLIDDGYLSDDDYKFLKPCGSKPGVMYGLCKVHNSVSDDDPVPPFRPILSAIGTCTYNLAKFFVPVLRELTVNEYTVKDSFSFCKEIVSQNSDLFMASFDVNHYLQIYLWTKLLIFVLIWFIIKEGKLKVCLNAILKNFLQHLLNRHVSFSMMCIINKLIVSLWGLLWDQR